MKMLTNSGFNFDVKTFNEYDFCLTDVAHANALNCRYNGHCNFLYSVSQHSLLVMHSLDLLGANKETQLYGLLHDAAEAYLSDVPTPIKALIPEYDVWETKILDVILCAVGKSILHDDPKAWLKEVNYDLVHKVDKSIVFYEMRELFYTFPTDFYFENVMMLPPFKIDEERAYDVESRYIKEYTLLQNTLKAKYKERAVI